MKKTQGDGSKTQGDGSVVLTKHKGTVLFSPEPN